MGSILSETVEAESIEKLVTPLKDLFGAIFFVSVGMMVDPHMLVYLRVLILSIIFFNNQLWIAIICIYFRFYT